MKLINFKKKHIYERVLHIYIDDIYIFGDIFAIIGENDLYVKYNCNKNIKVYKHKKFFKSLKTMVWKKMKKNMYENNTNKKKTRI